MVRSVHAMQRLLSRTMYISTHCLHERGLISITIHDIKRFVLFDLFATSERFNKFVRKEVTQAHKIAVSKHLVMCLALCQFDENTQASGVLAIADFTNFPLKFMSTMNLSESKDMMRFQVSGFILPLHILYISTLNILNVF